MHKKNWLHVFNSLDPSSCQRNSYILISSSSLQRSISQLYPHLCVDATFILIPVYINVIVISSSMQMPQLLNSHSCGYQCHSYIFLLVLQMPQPSSSCSYQHHTVVCSISSLCTYVDAAVLLIPVGISVIHPHLCTSRWHSFPHFCRLYIFAYHIHNIILILQLSLLQCTVGFSFSVYMQESTSFLQESKSQLLSILISVDATLIFITVETVSCRDQNRTYVIIWTVKVGNTILVTRISLSSSTSVLNKSILCLVMLLSVYRPDSYQRDCCARFFDQSFFMDLLCMVPRF